MSQDPNNPEVLKSFADELAAAALVAELEAHGIEASTTGGFTAGFRAEAPGEVHVIVRHMDMKKAQQILARLQQPHDDIDWSQVDVGEPEDE